MSFDPWNIVLKIRDSTWNPIPKVGVHLGVCGFIPSHSWECKCDSQVALSVHTFPCFFLGHELKVRVVTNELFTLPCLHPLSIWTIPLFTSTSKIKWLLSWKVGVDGWKKKRKKAKGDCIIVWDTLRTID
jgi:hypothetical protein